MAKRSARLCREVQRYFAFEAFRHWLETGEWGMRHRLDTVVTSVWHDASTVTILDRGVRYDVPVKPSWKEMARG